MDAAAGIVVAAIVVKTGIEILKSGVNELMDVSLSEVELAALREQIAVSYVEAKVTQIRSRKISAGCFLDITIQVDGGMTVDAGHQIADQVESIAENRISPQRGFYQKRSIYGF